MKNIVGLALGQKDIKLANISLKGRSVELLKLDAVEIPQNANQYEIINLVRSLFRNNQLKSNTPICLSIATEEAFLKIVSVKFRGTKKFMELVKDEFKKSAVLSLDECLWDYMPLRYNPKEINNDVLAVAAKKDLVLDKLGMFEQTNEFVVDVITLDILAVYNCLKFNTELSGNKHYALVNISSRKTQVFIFYDKDNFWVKSIPFGEEKFIEAIAKKLTLTTKEAQEYKNNTLLQENYSNAHDDILMPLMQEISKELAKTFNYYNLQLSASAAKEGDSKKIDEILLSGSGSTYPGVDKFLSDNLNIPSRYVYPFNKILVKDKKLLAKKNMLGMQSPEFSQAVGLALTGLNITDTKINLIKQTKKNFLQKIKLSYLYNILIVVCVGLLVFLWTQNGLYNKEIKQAEYKLGETNLLSIQSIPKIDKLKSEYDGLSKKSKALRSIIDNRNIISRVLYKISEIISQDIWITNFIFNMDYENNKGELTVSGKASNYAEINKLIAGLKDTGQFKSIQPVSSKVKIDEATKEEVVNFIIKLELGKD